MSTLPKIFILINRHDNKKYFKIESLLKTLIPRKNASYELFNCWNKAIAIKWILRKFVYCMPRKHKLFFKICAIMGYRLKCFLYTKKKGKGSLLSLAMKPQHYVSLNIYFSSNEGEFSCGKILNWNTPDTTSACLCHRHCAGVRIQLVMQQ